MVLPQLIRSCKVVLGVHVEEHQLGVAEPVNLFQREDTGLDRIMEGDRPEIVVGQSVFHRRPATLAVEAAQRLDTTPASAGWDNRVPRLRGRGQVPDEIGRHEGHVPGDGDFPGALSVYLL